MVRLTILATSDQTEPCIDELEVFTARQTRRANVALASAGGKASASSEYPGSRDPQDRAPERRPGRQQPELDLPDAGQGNGHDRLARADDDRPRRLGPRPRGKYRDRLATDYYLEAAVEPGDWHVVASSLDRAPFRDRRQACDASTRPDLRAGRERAELLARQAALARPARPAWARRCRSTPARSASPARPTAAPGRPDAAGRPRSCPSAVAAVGAALVLPMPARPRRDRRLALARWIGDPANPLPARVMVNRVWHYHFGQGIVATPSDFGFNGGPPSHPELLDWLAVAVHRRRLAAQADPPADRALGRPIASRAGSMRGPRPSTARTACSGG